MVTHALVTEAHGAGFSFAKVEEAAVGLDEGRAGAVFSSAAHFTGVLRRCKKRKKNFSAICFVSLDKL